MKVPIYNCTHEENAYNVESYPYGWKVRVNARFWLEAKESKGYRFCHQTKHPTKGTWNKPKKGTYHAISACMYLDEDTGHVEWAGFNNYDAEKALEYVQQFPNAPGIDSVKRYVQLKVMHLDLRIAGTTYFTINGVRQPYSEGEKARDIEEKSAWEKVVG